MPEYRHLVVSIDDGIVTVRLHRPDARNALNRALMRELTDVAREFRSRADVRAVVLAGGRDNFSAGADLAEAMAEPAQPPTLLELREALLAGPDMCHAWEEIEAITIGAIEGYCVGGACALALCLDFRVVGDGARMRLPEVPLGMNMSWRSLPRLASMIGPSRAKQFAIFGEFADSQTMLAWGMVDEVTAAGGAEAAALAWARKVAALPPLPVRMTKEAVNAAVNANHHATSHMDRDQFLLTFGSDDLQEGLRAFFEKRKPNFKGN